MMAFPRDHQRNEYEEVSANLAWVTSEGKNLKDVIEDRLATSWRVIRMFIREGDGELRSPGEPEGDRIICEFARIRDRIYQTEGTISVDLRVETYFVPTLKIWVAECPNLGLEFRGGLSAPGAQEGLRQKINPPKE